MVFGLALLAPPSAFAHPGHGLVPSAFDSAPLHWGVDHVLVPLAVGVWVLLLCAVAGNQVLRWTRSRASRQHMSS
jgi:hydrogenase/urease accessory protein HupE